MATGGCLCGEIRYEADITPDNCRDCQIGSASAFHVAVFSVQENFRLLAGELSVYSKVADSGRALDRLFCGKCGTPIAWTGEGFADVVLISLSSLDDPEAHSPVHEGWTDRAVSWCRISESVMSFPGRPVRS